MSNERLAELDQAFVEEDWEWLDLNHPALARSVALGVQRGATPVEIRTLILQRGGAHRIGIATRCENAARHLLAQKQRA